jgi:hypothetical protein
MRHFLEIYGIGNWCMLEGTSPASFSLMLHLLLRVLNITAFLLLLLLMQTLLRVSLIVEGSALDFSVL